MRQAFQDAQAALPFVIEQGRNIEAAVYRRRYPAFAIAPHVPIKSEGNAWAIGTTFFTVDVVGQAKFLSGSAADMPFVSSTRNQASHDFAMIGSGWQWTIEQVNQAALYSTNLAGDDAATARQTTDRLLYDIAMSGATEKGWTGLVNDAVVNVADVAADGTASSKFWSAKTVDLILRDVNALLERIRTRTSEIEYANTLRLPPAAFRDIATRRLGAGDGNMTALEYLRKNNIYTAETGQPLDIGVIRELATASGDSGGRMIAYRNDEEVLRYHLPMPIRVLAPRATSLMGFEQGLIARTGGLEIRLPEAVAYADEITAP